jgi:hypothetical protein
MKELFVQQLVPGRADSTLNVDPRFAAAIKSVRETREAAEKCFAACKRLAGRIPHHLNAPFVPVQAIRLGLLSTLNPNLLERRA